MASEEDWREITLGDVFVLSSERVGSYDDEPSVLSISKYDGVIPAGDFFNKRVASDKLDTYKWLRSDMWAYSTIHIDEGSIARNRLGRDGVVSPMYTLMSWSSADHLPEYFEALLRSPRMLTTYRESSQGTVDRRRSLPWKVFSKLTVFVPPKSGQRRVVDVIRSVDVAIEAAVEHAHASEQAYRALLTQLCDGRYPMATTREAVSIARAGGTPSRKEEGFFGSGTPWLKSGEVDNDLIEGASEEITQDGLKFSSAWLVPAGSTVVAMYGQGNTKGTAGWLVEPMATNQAVLALVPNPEVVDSRFLLHAIRSRTDSLRSRAIGAAQPNLSKELVMKEVIPLPTLAEQKSLSRLLDSLRESGTCARDEAASLGRLRSELLSSLVSGAHEIPASYDRLLENGAV
ncbi:restriction endonuclease subunit S [Streptomyces sp. ISL-90]|nr:restriction endonuclease subunit S [Streptomyces sp. ISL-90]